MKLFLKFLVFVNLLAIMTSCEKKVISTNEVSSKDSNQNIFSNSWIKNPYKLNVVYFVPNDLDTVENYNRRLSKIILDAQSFIGENMEREGFGKKSFGLDLINDSLISIHYIKGNFGKSAYPYTGGAAAVKKEIEAYYNADISRKKSEHTLVIIPTYTDDENNPGGPPFYGVGTYCYALDYKKLDSKYLGQNNQDGRLATKWIGGLVHELGHGLNARHNVMLKSLSESLGTALMGAGNSTYGKTKTALTKATAATFNNSQVFSSEVRSDWYQSGNAELLTFKTTLENNAIVLTGTFKSEIKVNDIVVWHDREPYGNNNDYDAVSWATKVIGQDSFRFVCPLADFYELNKEYELRIGFLHVNGNRTTVNYSYNFENNIPDLSQVQIIPLKSVQGWEIIGFNSSQEKTSTPQSVLDRNFNSIWHTQYSPSVIAHPHHFSIDMSKINNISGFAFFNRSNLNGAMKDVKIYKSNDGISWELVISSELPRKSGRWLYINLDNPIETQYVKVECTKSWNDVGYTHLAEFGVY